MAASKQSTLTVEAAHSRAAVEIALADGARVGRGVGRLSLPLDPGVYIVEMHRPTGPQEQLVNLLEGVDKTVSFARPPRPPLSELGDVALWSSPARISR